MHRAIPLVAALFLIFCCCSCQPDPDLPAGWSGRVIDKRHEPARTEIIKGNPATGSADLHRPLAEVWKLRLHCSWGKSWVFVSKDVWEDARTGDWIFLP